MFYHEDDDGTIEFLPRENYLRLRQQLTELDEHAQKHWDGAGYTDVYVVENAEMSLQERNIPVSELDALLSKLGLRRHTDVSTGIRAGEFELKNVVGFGENFWGILYAFEDDVVKRLYIANYLDTEDDEAAAEVLHSIGTKWDLLLVDWERGEMIDLTNKEQILAYLE